VNRSSLVEARHRIAVVPALGLAAVASVMPSVPAKAQQQTPQQMVRTFISTVNARRADCSLMIDDLVESFAVPTLLGQDLFAPQVLTQEQRLASCRTLIRGYNGLHDEMDQWRRTVIEHVSIAERTDTLVRLRVHIRHRYESGDDEQRITVWMELENGQWKLATHEKLLQLSGLRVPANMRQWPAYRQRIARAAAKHRAHLERRVASAREHTVAVLAQPLGCDGRLSQAKDPPRDVEFSSGRGFVPDQRRPTIDMLAASLHSQDDQYCWRLDFARPPGPSYGINLTVSRRSRAPTRLAVQPYVFQQEVTIVVRNGSALAGVDAGESESESAMNFVPVAVSQTDTIVRLRLARRDLFHRAGPFDGRHSFRWAIVTYEDNPTGILDEAAWEDTLTGPPHNP